MLVFPQQTAANKNPSLTGDFRGCRSMGRRNPAVSVRSQLGQISSPVYRALPGGGLLVALLLIAGRPVAAAESVLPERELKIPRWTLTTNVSAAAGYRDNVLLSPSQPQGSGFFRAEVEAMFLALPVKGFDGYVFFDAVELRFFSASQTDHERSAFITSEIHWQTAVDPLKASLAVQAYHHDQVFDVSVTEINLDTAALKVLGISAAPFVRWSFPQIGWVELKASGRREVYADDLDALKEGEGSLRLGRDWGYGSEISISAAERWRAHDSREQYTVGGRPLAGSRLKIRQKELRAQLAYVVDQKKLWRITLAAALEENRDNGTGYFDFHRKQITAGVAWQPTGWAIRLSAGIVKYDFLVQQVGFGITPENRHKAEFRLNVEVIRHLTKAWALVASYEGERARSNDDRSRFRINTSYLGLQWTWESLDQQIRDL